MKKTVLAVSLILALLVSALAGAQLNLFAKANFMFPPSKHPILNVTSPTNRTYNTATLSLEATVRTIKTVYYGGPESNTTTLFTYTLDGQNPENITITELNIARNPGGETVLKGSANLTKLTEGLHNLTVRVLFDYTPPTPSYGSEIMHSESVSTVNFGIDTIPPEVVILLLGKKTYFTTDIPLNLIVYEPDSQITYGLDGQENMTFAGNITLTNLSYGKHNVTVYAEDVVGNVAVSTIRFSIEPFPTTLFISTIMIMAVVSICLLVYFKKRNNNAGRESKKKNS